MASPAPRARPLRALIKALKILFIIGLAMLPVPITTLLSVFVERKRRAVATQVTETRTDGVRLLLPEDVQELAKDDSTH